MSAGIQTDSVLSARLQIIRIYIREDGRLVIEFKTHAKFRGRSTTSAMTFQMFWVHKVQTFSSEGFSLESVCCCGLIDEEQQMSLWVRSKNCSQPVHFHFRAKKKKHASLSNFLPFFLPPGQFVLEHHTLPGHKSHLMAPDHLGGIEFDIQLLWSAQTFDSPYQLWRATSSYSRSVSLEGGKEDCLSCWLKFLHHVTVQLLGNKDIGSVWNFC